MFAVEGMLRQKLTGIPGIRRIGTARDLEEVFEGQVQPPALYIVFDKGEVDKSEEAGPWRMMRQVWVIALATVDYSRPQEGDRDKADVFLEEINRRLMGAELGPGYEPLELLDLPRPSYLENINLYAMRYLASFPVRGMEEPS